MSGAKEQPGNTWVICEDEDGGVNVTVILGFGECLDLDGLNVVKHASFGIAPIKILNHRKLKSCKKVFILICRMNESESELSKTTGSHQHQFILYLPKNLIR